MPVEGVRDDRDIFQERRPPPEQSGLAGVGMDDVRSKALDQGTQGSNRPQISPRPSRPTQTSNPHQPTAAFVDLVCDQHRTIAEIYFRLASRASTDRQQRLGADRRVLIPERQGLPRRPSDVRPGQDAQHSHACTSAATSRSRR